MGAQATTDPPPGLEPGTVLDGRYRLDRMLGKGGVGWVFRAKHVELDSEVAIKVLQTMFSEHSTMRPRFVREARATAALKHPHIVTITDFSVSSGQPYIVMELLEGHTLYEEIAQGPFEPERARRVMARVLDGLAYAHGKGFIHRDLKPDNLFLLDLKSDDAFPKILDFGFVKLLDAEPQKPSDVLTRSGIAFGTPAYMSPEQATGAPADRRSDLYSLGIVFYEMLAGQRPYQGTLPEIVRQHLTAPVPSFEQIGVASRESLPLRHFLSRAMAKEPEQRFDNAAEMKRALLALPTPYVEAHAGSPPRTFSAAPTVAAVPQSRRSVEEARMPARRSTGGLRKAVAWLGLLLVLGVASVVLLTPDAFWSRLIGLNEVASSEPTAASSELPSAADGPALAAEPEREAEAEVAEVAAEEVAAEEETDPASARPDPWQGGAPAWLTRARRRVLAGRSLGSRTEDALKRYARSHRGDVRPHLLLAQSFRRRGWDASALERYDLAHRIDRGAVGDPQMLEDLVSMAARSTDTRRAAELVRSVYGADARQAVDAARADSDYTRQEKAKLRALRRRL